MKIKRSDLVVVVLLLLAAWNPAIPGLDGGIIRPTGPVTRVVVIHESDQTTPAIANVTGGATARALRDADKWRQWDPDSIPDEQTGLLAEAKEKPWCFVFHGKKITFSGRLPASEAEFATLVQKQGGVK